MLLILSVMILFLGLSLTLWFISILVSKKSTNKREKSSPFECGFDFISYPRKPFSLKFFLIAIIFIIFDVEIALILPLIPSILKSNIILWTVTTFLFMIILILGVFIEWKEKSFEWSL